MVDGNADDTDWADFHGFFFCSYERNKKNLRKSAQSVSSAFQFTEGGFKPKEIWYMVLIYKRK